LPAYVFDDAGATRALHLLGKKLGVFPDRRQVDVNVTAPEIKARQEAARKRVFELLKLMETGKLIEQQPAKTSTTEPRMRPARANAQPTQRDGPPPPGSWPT
jgi:hypothetical protein